MIDPNSIHVKKYKNEDEVLKWLLKGGSIRIIAKLCHVSTKTVQKIKRKHADKLPGKVRVKKQSGVKKLAGVKRWLTVPVDVDAKIEESARAEGRTWQDQVNFILRGWGDGK